jgi:hypothetical protein
VDWRGLDRLMLFWLLLVSILECLVYFRQLRTSLVKLDSHFTKAGFKLLNLLILLGQLFSVFCQVSGVRV